MARKYFTNFLARVNDALYADSGEQVPELVGEVIAACNAGLLDNIGYEHLIYLLSDCC